jgi:hypothetical protein
MYAKKKQCQPARANKAQGGPAVGAANHLIFQALTMHLYLQHVIERKKTENKRL